MWPQVDQQATLGHQRLLAPFPVFAMYVLSTIPTLRAVSKTDFREQRMRPSGWYVWLNPVKNSMYKCFKDYGRLVRRFSHLVGTQDKPHKFSYLTCHLSIWSGLPLQSLLALHVWGPFQMSPRELWRLWINTYRYRHACKHSNGP